ncbi:MAG: hypothetical protein WBX15_04220 [Thermoanaerobaculia bacterium]
MMHRYRVILFCLTATLISAIAVGQVIPIKNWPAPPTWTPPAGSSGQLSAQTHLSPAIPFVAITPCRVYDSRSASILTGGTSRTINVDGTSCATWPSTVEAYSINITAFGSTSGGGYAFLTAYPTGSTRPTVATLNFLPGTQVGNSAVIPAGTGNDIDIYSTATTHFTIDINGYYSSQLPQIFGPTMQFVVSENCDNCAAILGQNGSTAAGSHGVGGFASGAGQVYGVQGQVSSSATSSSAGVHGISDSSASSAFGVYGQITTTSGGAFSAAVRGQHSGTGGGGIGVWGSHDGGGWGVYGTSSTGYAGYFSSNGGISLLGVAGGTSGTNYGVKGTTSSTSNGAAGVLGVASGGTFDFATGLGGSSGVVAMSQGGPAILALSTGRAVQGSTGTVSTGTFSFSGSSGILGFSSTSGVHAFGDITASGTKSFVEPHPTEAGKIIRYIALEGGEAGTYFRGRSHFSGGMAVIPVPEDFRLTTTPDSLSVQITPIGDLAQVAVVSVGLDQIMVKASKDVEFYYMVNGVRAGFDHFEPVQRDRDEFFIPKGPDDRLENVWGAEIRKRLVENGTFNSDGSVNMDTARVKGWTKVWAERAEAQREAAELARERHLNGQQQQLSDQ